MDISEKYSGQHSFDESQIEKGHKFLTESQKAQDEIQDLKLLINRKSRFLNWLLVHYKQNYVNPINDWKKQAKEEVDNRKQSANKSIQPPANATADCDVKSRNDYESRRNIRSVYSDGSFGTSSQY